MRAAERSANVEAIAHLSKGLALLDELPTSTERDKIELDLRIALGPVQMAALGVPSKEAEQTYTRVRDLAEHVGDSDSRFTALYGVWQVNNMSAAAVKDPCLSPSGGQTAPDDDEAMMLRVPLALSSIARQEPVELPCRLKRRQVIVAADVGALVGALDEDLGNGVPFGPLHHFGLPGSVVSYIDLSEGDALSAQQRLSSCAVWAVVLRVNLDRVHCLSPADQAAPKAGREQPRHRGNRALRGSEIRCTGAGDGRTLYR